jgi:hypothetical protein
LAGGWLMMLIKYCWLMIGGWFVLREKYCWLVADKPDEHSDSYEVCVACINDEQLDQSNSG